MYREPLERIAPAIARINSEIASMHALRTMRRLTWAEQKQLARMNAELRMWKADRDYYARGMGEK